jgi:multicomponent Na+:H+ antiporter subunit A
MLLVTAVDPDSAVTRFYELNSYLAAHGRNIVNVILVDFRSLDTLGEIVVVVVAALGAVALLRQVKEAK